MRAARADEQMPLREAAVERLIDFLRVALAFLIVIPIQNLPKLPETRRWERGRPARIAVEENSSDRSTLSRFALSAGEDARAPTKRARSVSLRFSS